MTLRNFISRNRGHHTVSTFSGIANHVQRATPPPAHTYCKQRATLAERLDFLSKNGCQSRGGLQRLREAQEAKEGGLHPLDATICYPPTHTLTPPPPSPARQPLGWTRQNPDFSCGPMAQEEEPSNSLEKPKKAAAEGVHRLNATTT